MKKKIIIIASLVLILLILFLPIPRGTYKDGGTKDYTALTYRIVVWNRLADPTGGDIAGGGVDIYHKTSVFWFPNNFLSIDELWKLECGNEMTVSGSEIDFTASDAENVSFQHSDHTAEELREKYPAYFGLSTFKGFEVYVWQLAPDSYSCGVMEGTNREKTLEELMNLQGASIDEMKAILSSYDIPKENISVIPWQNPISSYLAEYWIDMENEAPEVAAKRQQYIDMLREMLLG